jgi:hypothetical protein
MSALAALQQNLGRLESARHAGLVAAEVLVLREMFDARIRTLRLGRSKKHGKES